MRGREERVAEGVVPSSGRPGRRDFRACIAATSGSTLQKPVSRMHYVISRGHVLRPATS